MQHLQLATAEDLGMNDRGPGSITCDGVTGDDRPKRIALIEVVLAGAALSVALTIGVAGVRNSMALSALVLTASITLIVTGYLLRWDEEQARAGLSLYAAAVFLSTSDVVAAFGPTAALVAQVTSWWAVPPLGLVLLTYPGRRPARRWHGWLLVAVAVEFMVLWTAASLISLHDTPTSTVAALDTVLSFGGPLLPILACVALVQRWQSSAPPERKAVRSMTIVGVALCATFAVRLLAFAFADHGAVAAAVHEVARTVNLVCLGVAPIGLLLETIRRRAAQRTTLEDLLWASGDPTRVQAAMARALNDPTLTLAFALHDATSFVDATGADLRTPLPHATGGRLVRELRSRDGDVIGLVDTDASSASDAAQLRIVLAGAALGLDNARLQASLLNSLQEVRTSRARIVEAGFRARRNLERDLHDGAQQQLLAVAATLARAEILTADEARARAVTDARSQLSAAIGELRRLARGIHPAVLSQSGLMHALPTLADTTPVPLDVDIPVGLRSVRLPPVVEATLWFVAAEAVTNAARHSSAHRIRVRLRVEEDHAHLQVRDDGRGGARAVPGGGLAGLADRVAALGGELSLDSPAGGGTQLEVLLPCVS